MSMSLSVTKSASSAVTGMRVWLYRLLVLVSAALFAVSWVIPWWRSNIQESGLFVQIRPWGLEHNLGVYADYMAENPNMPAFFAPMMWAYLVVAIAVLLASLFLMNRTLKVGKFTSSLSRVLVGLVGLSYIIFVLVFFVYANLRVASIGVEFLGTSYITIAQFELGAEAISSLQPGVELACLVGPLCVVLALLHDKIIGQQKLNA